MQVIYCPESGFLPAIFQRAKSIVTQIYVVTLIFPMFSDKILGGGGGGGSRLWKKARIWLNVTYCFRHLLTNCII